MNLLKSLLHNIGVVIVGFALAFLGTRLDILFHAPEFRSSGAIVGGCVLLALGFLLRVWATWYFYENHMKVIKLSPQSTLITGGPYRLSRNPLYLGGNVFIFFGASILLGSPCALAITVIGIPITDLMIRREEKQLAHDFGEEWTRYASRVRRWI